MAVDLRESETQSINVDPQLLSARCAASEPISVLHSVATYNAICLRLSTDDAYTSVCPNGVVTSWGGACIKDANNTSLLMAAGKCPMHHSVWKVGCVQRRQVIPPSWGIDGSLFVSLAYGCHHNQKLRCERWRWLRIEGWMWLWRRSLHIHSATRCITKWSPIPSSGLFL